MHTSEKVFFEDFLPSSDGKLSTFWVVEATVDNKIVACGGYSLAVTPIFDGIIKNEELVYPVELKVNVYIIISIISTYAHRKINYYRSYTSICFASRSRDLYAWLITSSKICLELL